ncbi:MAG: hypothetical protein JW837_09845 [Sedimentisphaerales bacterium]|nr:hypothetical protein [Sedimentisphaerales bacterium]
MKDKKFKSEKGLALVAVVVFTCLFIILGFSMLNLAKSEIVVTKKELNSARAFYVAEAGLEQLTAKLYKEEFEDIPVTDLGGAKYKVELNFEADPPYAIATGKAGMEVKKIKAELTFLSHPYEKAVYAGNVAGGKWMFSLRGQGDPKPIGWTGAEVGGKDIVNGNVYVNGNATMYEESSVNPSPMGNFKGDINSTGTASILDEASVSGEVTEGAVVKSHPSLNEMSYAVNNTHNVSKIFADAGIDSGYLPSGNELRNVMVKNPGDRWSECNTTSGDDYFLEPMYVNNFGAGSKDAKTPLDIGENRIYYVDGDVWIHNSKTYGFLVDGKVTIVATGNIHISDNVKYANDESLLGLIALGKYDGSGNLISGGNIYFGDPRYGTMYTVSALMFAADSFFYNTDSVTGGKKEPETGFSVYGNLNALNQVSVERDWYDPDGIGSPRPAFFDTSFADENRNGLWVDLETGEQLSSEEINSLRHYQMKISYDDRVRTHETQPPGLPKGEGTIFGGLKYWQEIPADSADLIESKSF